MKRNYWWKRSYCWRDHQQTSYSGNIVRKIFVKLKHEKTAKRKLCQSQTWKWNYWWIGRQKQTLKIAVAHHDRNNVPTIIFCECQQKLLPNQLWMKIFPWKSFCQTWNRNMNMRKKLLLMRSSKLEIYEIFSGKSLSNRNMDNGYHEWK